MKTKFLLKLKIIFAVTLAFTACFSFGCKETKSFPSGFSVHFIDVGNGDSAYICFADGKNMLIDCGSGRKSANENIISLVESSNKNEIDYLVLTHTDSDHVGGKEVLEKFKVKSAFIPKVNDLSLFPSFSSAVSVLESYSAEIKVSKQFISFSGEDYFVAFLSPEPESFKDSPYADFNGAKEPTENMINSTSAVIYVSFKGVRFLFTGDAPLNIEKKIINDYKSGLYEHAFTGGKVNLENIDYLKLGHHGANDSTSKEFLELLNPKTAVISCGGGSSFPSTEVLYRLSEFSPDTTVLRTDKSGTISVTVHGDGQSKIL